MKLLILGATGVVGGWTTRKATSHGHEVTIYVRNESKVPDDIKNSGVKVRRLLLPQQLNLNVLDPILTRKQLRERKDHPRHSFR